MKNYHVVSIGIIACGIAGLAACTDATQSQIMAYGSAHQITCHDYGQVIYEGKSTGKVKEDNNGRSYVFEDQSTKSLTEINMGYSGSCVVRVIN